MIGSSLQKKKLTSFQTIIFGFALVIVIGAVLLSLPISSQARQFTPFSESLFTSTSAVCVTGLVVHDTATYWSLFGQAVILVLIQIGGVGVITVAATIAIISGRKLGLMQRSLMQEAMSAPHVGGIVRLTGFLLRTTFSIEAIGAVILSTVFIPEMGFARGLWASVFHSISAFCNAGFDLMGTAAPYSSLTAYAAHPVVNLAIMLLIISGGIGFLTWDDIWNHHFHFRKYRMQTKVILTVTGFLILLPALYFFLFEFENEDLPRRILMSFFQSVSPRTAGFNTADLTLLSERGLLLTIILMVIGGSPGSTAGGMKTTTAAVLAAAAGAVFHRRDSAHVFGRRIADDTIRHAIAILMLYVILFTMSGMIISGLEDLPLLTSLFETASAIGTVGLSLGATPTLSLPSHIILIGLMFFGRVGGLTLIYAAVADSSHSVARFPQEKITVG